MRALFFIKGLKALHNRLTLKANLGSINIGLVGVGGWGVSNAVNIMRCRRFKIDGVYDKQLNTVERFAAGLMSNASKI